MLLAIWGWMMTMIKGLIDGYRRTRERDSIRLGFDVRAFANENRDVGVMKALVKRRREEACQIGVVVDRGWKEKDCLIGLPIQPILLATSTRQSIERK